MVGSVFGFGRSGLQDWIIQRISAVVLLVYILFLAGFFFSRPEISYSEWQTLFSATWMRIFSLFALLSLCAHAWVGMWTIATDYLIALSLGKYATRIRFVFLLICIAILATYFIWCVQILWSI